ncbi:DsrE family protein [Pseudoalteromonas sp. T1lg65]|uniref:DsrE family protein n=1 Tax=Pseudoalteromonas sp. T1lg65 TaxID=2077101 RepID=UPI003F7AC305
MKNVLVISTASPFQSSEIRDALDLTLIFAAVDQNISWLFLESSVLALKSNLNAPALSIKNYFKQLKTLEIYDVEQIYTTTDALSANNLRVDDLDIETVVLNDNEVSDLIAKQDLVVRL